MTTEPDRELEQLTKQVQAIVARVAGPDRTPRDAGPDTPVGEEGFWLDSVDPVEVIVRCGEELRIPRRWPSSPESRDGAS
jgi:acyl carrier protein